MRNVTSLIKAIGYQRGAKRESAVDVALADMKRSGEIVSFHKAGKRADKFQGIDYFVIGIEGEKIPLQVKSSLTGALEHKKKFSNVPVVVIGVEDTESIKNKIRKLLQC